FLKRKSIFKFLAKVLSNFFFFKKRISNYFLNSYEFSAKKNYLHSYPTAISLNTTNLCNYRCSFCEIHYFYNFAKEMSGKVFSNHLDIDFIKKFENLFDKAISVEMSGAAGEPFANLNFLKISKNLKEKGLILAATTNGYFLDKLTAKKLVEMRFNHLVVSLHSGEEQNYMELQGGNFNKIIDNLKCLIEIREKKGFNKPLVSINTLIFSLNQHTILPLIKKMKEIKVDEINIVHYYASRNKLNHKASFYNDPEKANLFLKEIYGYANSLNFKLTPENPSFLDFSININISSDSHICENPWKEIKFKGCVEFENSHYITVCNRILLFRLNYKEFEGDFINDIWNHEIIRYFRKNLMNNPICQFCQDSNTPKLRCLDNKKYQILRDKTVREFFAKAMKDIKIKSRKGIYMLDKNPYEYRDYYERLNLR
ncbi:MAG: radical SAM protein, partial [Candidatus Hodarchaeota archaeon]